MSERVVWGLDLGQTGLRAVKLERGKGSSVRMTDAFFCPIDGLPDDPQHEDKVRDALDAFIAAKDPKITPVVISLPGYTTLFRSFPLPEVHPSKLREVVYYEAKQLIPYPLEEVQWDFQQLGVNEENGELQIALLCCRRDIIDNLLAMADEAGLTVEDVQVGPVALANFCLYDNPPQGRAMLLDCGARSTDFVMFDESSFWLRSIAVCGDDISRTLMNKFSISFEEAEQLKSNMSDAKQASRVFKVVEPVMRSLAGEAQRSFGFYRSNKRGASVDEMILAGNTFLMEGADQYMADSLGYGARTLDLPAAIGVSAGVDGEELAANRQVYGIAAGLALQGLGLGTFTCSLLPDARRLRKLIKRKEKYGWAAAAAIVVTVLLHMVTTTSQKPLFEGDMRKIEAAKGRAKAKETEYQTKMQQFEPALKSNRAMLEVKSGRGLLTQAADLVHHQIEMLNQARFAKVSPLPVTNLSQKAIISNLKSNIMGWPASRQMYEALLKEKTAEFKIDQQTDAEIKKDMQENLETQVLRRVAIQHNRIKRSFLETEDYSVVRGAKNVEDGDTTWEIEGIAEEAGTGRAESEERTPSAGGRPPAGGGQSVPGAPGAAADAGKAGEKPQDLVLIRFKGFVVTQDAEDLHELNERLKLLKGAGLYLQNFKVIRAIGEADSNNTINLPKIYDPTPKPADLDSAGENGTIDRSEKLEYEPFSKEKISRFEVRMVYEPLAESTDAQATLAEELIRKALADAAAKPETKPAGEKPAAPAAAPEAKKEEAKPAAPAPAAPAAAPEAKKEEAKPAAPAPAAPAAAPEAKKEEAKPAAPAPAAPAAAPEAKKEEAKPAAPATAPAVGAK